MKINIDWDQLWETLGYFFRWVLSLGGPDGVKWGIGIVAAIALVIGAIVYTRRN